jgi:hypothetical protein
MRTKAAQVVNEREGLLAAKTEAEAAEADEKATSPCPEDQ